MINEMISNENAKFNMLEEKIYLGMCMKGLEILKEILEKVDEEILELYKGNPLFEVHDITETTVKTIMGDCKYKRRRWYEYKNCKGKKVRVGQRYFLDELLEIKFCGTYSKSFVDIIIEAFTNCNSYRETANVIEKITNETVSYSQVRNIVLELGKQLMEQEEEIIKANKEEKLIPEEQREVPMLFGETDGMFVSLQGKDKEKVIEKKIETAKKNLQGDELDKKIESIKRESIKKEIKMACFHEGWR